MGRLLRQASVSPSVNMVGMTALRPLADLDDDALGEVYASPRTPWLRLNFVATVDGAVQGDDGLSKSIQNDADQRVFQCLRGLADVLVVGAGTVREEGYRPNPLPLVVVSRSGQLPPSLLEGDLDRVFMATGSGAPYLAETRRLLGAERVWELGASEPDLRELRRALEERGHANLLSEGGPHLSRGLLAAGVVDELCLTLVPRMIAGAHLRLLAGPPVDVPLQLHTLLEHDGTLLGRWLVG